MIEASSSTGWRSLLPALSLLAASVVLVFVLSFRFPAAGDQVALVFPFGISADDAFLALADIDARPVRRGGMDNILIAQFDHVVSWSELRRAGVLMSLDPILAGGCAITAETGIASNRERSRS